MNTTVEERLDKVGFETLETISKADRFNYWMYKTIQPFIKGKVLELGCGIGNISDFLIKDFSEITLSDYNPEYYDLLKKKYKSLSNVKDILKIDLQDPLFEENYKLLRNTFDTIILLNVIEHLKDDRRAVQYCHFLLKPGGYFIVLAPAYNILYSPLDKELGHYRRYSGKSLISLLKTNNFSIIHKKHFNLLGMLGWFVFNTLGRRKHLKSNELYIFNRLVPVAKIIDKLLGNKMGLSFISVAKRQ